MAIDLVIPNRSASIGAFDVRRVLPFRKRRSVGPFVFVDDFGPIEAVNSVSLDVLAHPHIGLATVTYLFSGKMTHRDSLGSVQEIAPGEVNWMTAGRGVVHSERISDVPNAPGERIVGLQTWVALPENMEESEPSFAHHTETELPGIAGDGVRIKLILGEGFQKMSPVAAVSNPFYAECDLTNGSSLEIPKSTEERAVYILSGNLSIDNKPFETGTMVVFENSSEAVVRAIGNTKFMIIGGDHLEKPRFMWWNFVSTSHELIEKARRDWRAGNFDAIPNETGFVPLPEGNVPKPQVL